MKIGKKALILVDHGSKVKEANNLLQTISEIIRKRHDTGFDIVIHSHMELAEPSIEQAFEICVKKGASKIVVHPYFLVPGRHSKTDIPNMVSEAARNHPQIEYRVTEPLGIHENIIDVIIERTKD